MPSEDLAVEGRLKGYIESVRGTQLAEGPADLVGKHLVNDLALDSLDIMNLLFQIEEKEKVEITEADMEAHSLYGFGQLADYIRRHKTN